MVVTTQEVLQHMTGHTGRQPQQINRQSHFTRVQQPRSGSSDALTIVEFRPSCSYSVSAYALPMICHVKPAQGNASYKPHETIVFYLGTAVNKQQRRGSSLATLDQKCNSSLRRKVRPSCGIRGSPSAAGSIILSFNKSYTLADRSTYLMG